MSVESLITKHIDIWTSAVQTKSTSGRGTSSKLDLYGIKKLRELILELAVRGKLVPQDSNDEPASVLLERIENEKAQLLKEKKIKKQKVLEHIDEKEFSDNLPSNWALVRLGEVVQLENGDRSKNYPNKSTLVDSGIPFVNAGHLINGRIDKSEMTFITNDHYDLLRSGKFVPNDILFCLRGSLGKSAIVDEVECGAIASSLVIIRAYQGIFPTYLHRFFLSGLSFRQIKKYDNGTAQPNLSATDLAKFTLPVPPLKEQHRIVAKVDELMRLCDQLEQQTEASIEAHQVLVETLLETLTNSADADELMENWQRISTHFDTLFTTEASIDQLKQTILQLAVMGKLVPQDPNDEPASILLDRIAEEKAQLIKEKKIKKQKALPPIADDEKPFELPEGWEWCRVQDVAMFTTSGSRDWAKYYSETGALFVTMGNLSRGSYDLRLDTLRYVQPPQGGEGSRTKLEANDLLISITGDVGNLGLIPENFGEAYINQHTCLLRFMPECHDKYFPEFMRSPWAKFQFEAPQRGIKNSFRLSDVGEMLLPLPPKQERFRIALKIDELLRVCDLLKSAFSKYQETQVYLTDAIVEQVI
jgi:type I restriction enzyme, S subunit